MRTVIIALQYEQLRFLKKPQLVFFFSVEIVSKFKCFMISRIFKMFLLYINFYGAL